MPRDFFSEFFQSTHFGVFIAITLVSYIISLINEVLLYNCHIVIKAIYGTRIDKANRKNSIFTRSN
jgi:hypothetical protein